MRRFLYRNTAILILAAILVFLPAAASAAEGRQDDLSYAPAAGETAEIPASADGKDAAEGPSPGIGREDDEKEAAADAPETEAEDDPGGDPADGTMEASAADSAGVPEKESGGGSDDEDHIQSVGGADDTTDMKADRETGDGITEDTDGYPAGGDAESRCDSGYRLILGLDSGAEADFGEGARILSSYENIRLIQYGTAEALEEAYARLLPEAAFVQKDLTMAASGGTDRAGEVSGTVMTEEQNPLQEMKTGLEKAGRSGGKGRIALIDTGVCGVPNVVESVSMIGSSAADDNGHGTMTARAVAAENPEAEILSVKVLGADGRGDASAVFAGILYAVERGASVIVLPVTAVRNQSFAAIEQILAKAAEDGITVIGAAGNFGQDAAWFIPGCLEEIYVIGACDASGIRRVNSNYGSTVDYYVRAESTSLAAARFAGIFSRTGRAAHDNIRVFLPDTCRTEPMVRVSYYFYENGDTDAVSDYATFYTNLCRNERELFVHTKPFPDDIDLAGAGYLSVRLNFPSDVTREKEITKRCRIDAESGLVTIPKEYEDEKISVIIMLPEDDPACAKIMDLASRHGGETFQAASAGVEPADHDYGDGPLFIVRENTCNYAHTDNAELRSLKVGDKYEVHYGLASYIDDWNDKWASINAEAYRCSFAFAININYVTTADNRFSTLFDDIGAVGPNTSWKVGSPAAMVRNTADGNTSPACTVPVEGWNTAGRSGNINPSTQKWIVGDCIQPGNTATGVPYVDGADGMHSYIHVKNVEHSGGRLIVTFYLAGYDSTSQNIGAYFKLWTEDAGSLVLQKKPQDGTEEFVRNNSCYSFFGTTFQIYRDAGRTIPAGTLVTGADGTSNELTGLAAGRYWYEETKAGKGYVKKEFNAGTDFVDVRAGQRNWITVENVPKTDPAAIAVRKVNRAAQTSAADMSGAEFTVCFYPGTPEREYYESLEDLPESPARSWVLRTDRMNRAYFDEEHRVSGDEYYKDPTDGTPCLPFGTLTIVETKAPKGFRKDPVLLIDGREAGSGRILIRIGEGEGGTYLSLGNQRIGGDEMAFADEPDYRLATHLRDSYGDRYHLAERNVILTDTLEYRNFYGETEVTVKGTLTDRDTGKTLAAAEMTEALPSAEGTLTMTFPAVDLTGLEGHTVYASETILGKDGKVRISHDGADDPEQQVVIPEIGTAAKDAETGERVSRASEERRIIDTVSYSGMEPGKRLVMRGWLTDRETGEEVRDTFGETVTVEKEFTVSAAGSGRVELEFVYSVPPEMAGRSVVVFEECGPAGEERIYAMHADPGDEDQTIHFPEIATKAASAVTGIRTPEHADVLRLTDTIEYKNVVPGKTYLMTAVLVMKDSGERVMLFPGEEGGPEVIGEGTAVSASREFVPGASEGKVEVTLELEKSRLAEDPAGKDIVFFEELTLDGKTLAVHQDPEDEDQTIFIPEGHTELKDELSRSHSVRAEKDRRVTDTFVYRNLIPGVEYTLTGQLMIRETDEDGKTYGKPLTGEDGPVSAARTFIPEEKDGEVTLEFVVDTSGLAGRDITAFETVSYGDIPVIVHHDIDDEKQTISVPDGYTSAADSRTGNHTSRAAKDVILVDTITYKNLTAGQEYTAEGILMDADSEGAVMVSGSPVTSSAVFIPEEPDGTVEVVFAFDGTELAGKKTVVFEEISANGELVFEHKDFRDEEQSVAFPKLRTNASLQDSGKKAFTDSGDFTVTDKVSYEGLSPGTEYRLAGEIMDKGSGKSTGIRAETVFTPAAADGTAEVRFALNTDKLGNGSYVVFETAFERESGQEIGSHRDLTDSDQTFVIRIGSEGQGKTNVRTGDRLQAGRTALIGCMAAAAAAVLIILRRRLHRQ